MVPRKGDTNIILVLHGTIFNDDSQPACAGPIEFYVTSIHTDV